MTMWEDEEVSLKHYQYSLSFGPSAHCESSSLLFVRLVWACVKRKSDGSGESVLVWWEQKVLGGLWRFYSEWLSLLLSLLLRCGVWSWSRWPELYLCREVHWSSFTFVMPITQILQLNSQRSPVLTASGLLKMIVKGWLVGILKHCCCAKVGAACLMTYHSRGFT